MRFIPVNFGSSDDAVGQSNPSDAFQFSPAPRTETAPEPHDLPDSAPDSYGFNVFNLTDDLEMHAVIVDWLALGSNLPDTCDGDSSV